MRTHITDFENNFPDIDMNDLYIFSCHFCILIFVIFVLWFLHSLGNG